MARRARLLAARAIATSQARPARGIVRIRHGARATPGWAWGHNDREVTAQRIVASGDATVRVVAVAIAIAVDVAFAVAADVAAAVAVVAADTIAAAVAVAVSPAVALAAWATATVDVAIAVAGKGSGTGRPCPSALSESTWSTAGRIVRSASARRGVLGARLTSSILFRVHFCTVSHFLCRIIPFLIGERHLRGRRPSSSLPAVPP